MPHFASVSESFAIVQKSRSTLAVPVFVNHVGLAAPLELATHAEARLALVKARDTVALAGEGVRQLTRRYSAPGVAAEKPFGSSASPQASSSLASASSLGNSPLRKRVSASTEGATPVLRRARKKAPLSWSDACESV
jgi:hypothetical protein